MKYEEAMEMRVEHEENRIYLLNEEDIEAGEILFDNVGEDILVVNHTYVHDGFSGQGVGKKLITAVVERARKENRKIRPVCEFAQAILTKNEDYHDVLEK
ncbi:MAG: N-acetyltransferase [Clostridia bacterium]|nr:N-acetyltransferase [Clostridia bacterium]